MVFDRRESLSWTCDKLRMKEEAVKRCSDVAVPRTLWTGVNLGDLHSFEFPDRWVLKPNHGSQDVILGEGAPAIEDLIERTSSWLNPYVGIEQGEWAYVHARPLYVLEEWIGDGNTPPPDYKFFVFNGTVKMIQVDTDRFQKHKVAIFSPEWNRLEVSKSIHAKSSRVTRPPNLDRMIEVAEKIAAEFDFMRVDLFDTPYGVYFGEVTPYPGSGISPFSPPEYDYILGSYWELPHLKPITTGS